MTIARAQMYRQLYQMGGQGIMQLGNGQEEPIFPRLETLSENLGQAEQTLGTPSNDQFNMSSITTAITGRPQMNIGGRMGYQEGDMAMMQPEGIMNAMPQEAGGMQQGADQGQNALLTIIQLLIEEGIDPETAKEIAGRILEAFTQGGEPAVEALANQLEQEEGMQQQPMMMAGGGLTSIDRARDMLQSRAPRGEFLAYINPQEAEILKSMGGAGQDVNVRGVPSYFKKIFKSVAKAVKSVAKSPIGMIALSIAAPYAISAFAPGFATLGGSGILGGALRAGISNLAIQGITTGKINPKQALLAAAAGGALSGIQGAGTVGQTTGITPEGINLDAAYGDMTPNLSSSLGQTTAITPEGINLRAAYESPSISSTGSVPSTAPASTGFGATIDRGIASIQDIGSKLMSDPIATIGRGFGAAYDYAQKNPGTALLAATAALGALTPQQPGEPNETYQQRKAEYDKRVAEYITQYGGGAKVYSPGVSGLYAMEGAIDPFAGRSSYFANGGRTGYAEGTSFERQTLEKKGYGDMIKNMTPKEISQLYDSVMGTFSRRFQAEGSMPMGEPRKNPAGIMELDYRAKGGFVPPIGIKEKADDIPAMLSNNEFVFTANAVRNAGGGNVNKGAERMYNLMKQLETGGVV